MIAGIGVDLVDVPAFAEQLADPASAYVTGTFTAAEHRDAQGRSSADPARHLAARHAAKEAFIKAWSVARWGSPPALAAVDMTEIEVLTDGHGRPALRLSGQVAAAVATLGEVNAHLSMSHDGDRAIAMVVLERGLAVAEWSQT